MPVLLSLVIAIPFLLVLPGFFLTKLCQSLNRIEKSILSVLLSMIVVYAGLFAVEKIGGKLTPLNTILTVAVINLTCFVVFLLTRRKQPQQSH